LKKILLSYKKVERHILYVILGKFFLDLVSISFFILLNFLFTENGYQDYEASSFYKYRFAAVMFLGFPLGLFIKGKRLRHFFLLGAFIVPIAGLSALSAIAAHADAWINVSLFFMGVGFALTKVSALPYVVLNTDQDKHSESIALLYLTWSVASLVAGAFNFLGAWWAPDFFNVTTLLTIYCWIGFLAIPLFYFNRKPEKISERVPFTDTLSNYDWGLIGRVVFPTLFIAVGAGFSIPFINLFFEYVHGVDFDVFSLIVFCTHLLVISAVLVIPTIKRNYGYKVAITRFQSFGIFCLIMLAATEWYSHMSIAVYVAILFFIIRQPSMSVAGPMTSELSLYYVGKKNQELIAALQASIWNGCWFISSFLFTIFRKSAWPYSRIFLLTAGLYIIGVLGYAWLIRDYERRPKSIIDG